MRWLKRLALGLLALLVVLAPTSSQSQGGISAALR